MTKETRSDEKKPYVKPELRRVTLKPEETLAAGCKTVSTSAAAATPCSLNSCFNIGS